MVNKIKTIYLFSATLLFCGCGMNSHKNEETTLTHDVDSAYSNKFLTVSSDYLNAIERANFIEWMLLDPFSNNPDTTLMIGGGEVLFRKTDSTKERVDAVISTLTNKKSFPASDYVKESTFMPDLALRFIYDKDTVIVAYSFYCDLCRFQKGYKYADYDGEKIRKELLRLSLQIFSNDKYLRELNRRER